MNPSVYLGLFLIGFALYANQLNMSPNSVQALPVKVNPTPAPEPTLAEKPLEKFKSPSERLQNLFQRIKEDDLFQKNVDGLTVEFQEDSILVRMMSDELYEDGEFAIRKSWMNPLDRIAKLIKIAQKDQFKIKIYGFADLANPHEIRIGDLGSSDYSLSSMRAEWVARYFERQWGLTLRGKVQIIGQGGIAKGKRIDFELY